MTNYLAMTRLEKRDRPLIKCGKKEFKHNHKLVTSYENYPIIPQWPSSIVLIFSCASKWTSKKKHALCLHSNMISFFSSILHHFLKLFTANFKLPIGNLWFAKKRRFFVIFQFTEIREWQRTFFSNNWMHPFLNERFVAVFHHTHASISHQHSAWKWTHVVWTVKL